MHGATQARGHEAVVPRVLPAQAAAAQAQATNLARAVEQAEAAAQQAQQELRAIQPPFLGVAQPPNAEEVERRVWWRPLLPPIMPAPGGPPPYVRGEAAQGVVLERVGNVAQVNVGAALNEVANILRAPPGAPAVQAFIYRPAAQPAPVTVQVFRAAGGIAIATPEGNTIFIPIEELLRAVPELQQRQPA